MVVQLPGGGVAKRQPAGIALLLSPGNNDNRVLLTVDVRELNTKSDLLGFYFLKVYVLVSELKLFKYVGVVTIFAHGSILP